MRIVISVLWTALAFVSTAHADEPWVGRWALDPQHCSSFTTDERKAPLIVAEKSLSRLTTSCWIGKLYRIGADAYIQAHCNNQGATVPISLKPHGDRMTVIWNNASLGEMRRCL